MISVPHPSQLGGFTELTNADEVERPSKRRAVVDDHELVVLDEEEEGSVQEDNTNMWTKGTVVIPESECEFTSILELRQEVKAKGNRGGSCSHFSRRARARAESALESRGTALIVDACDILLKHAFVGIADLHMGLSLIQYSTRLYLANHTSLA
jgi:DNA mismatch repair protein MLH1